MQNELGELLPEMKQRMWQHLDSIRGAVPLDEYHVIFYFLLLHREGLLDSLDLSNAAAVKAGINNTIRSLDNNSIIKQVHQVYEPIIININDKAVFPFIQLFKSLNQEVLTSFFTEIFDELMYNWFRSLGKHGSGFLLPAQVSHFMCTLFELPEHSYVYNPFAGAASFAVFLPKAGLYLGQEISKATWAIGVLRILAYKRECNAFLMNENSVNNWSNKNVYERFSPKGDRDQSIPKFDLIIADPPFGSRINPIAGKFGIINTCEHFLVEKGIDDLAAKGKLVCVLPQAFLVKTGPEQELRKYLVENDLIELIISLPKGLGLQSIISTVIFVVNRDKKDKGVVRFVKGDDCFKNPRLRERILDEDALSAILRMKNDSDTLRIVSNNVIVDHDFNLNPSRYFLKIFEGVELSKLLKPVRLERTNKSLKGRLVRIKDLKEEKFNYGLDLNTVEVIDIPKGTPVISQACLLISSGEKLRTTYFNYINEPLYVYQNIFAFAVDEGKVDLDYLVSELNGDITLSQIVSMGMGTVMSRLRKEDFLSIKIELPTIAEQKAKVKGLKEEHIKSKEKEIHLERELLGLKDDAFREFASVNHTFRQYLNALKSNVSGTKKFILKNEGQSISLSSIYSRNLNQTLGEHLLSLEGTINSMSKLLTSFDDETLSLVPQEVYLDKLIIEAQNRFTNNEIFKFEKLFIDWESLSQFDGSYIAPNAYIHPEDFFRVFSNIIANAIDHGFRNRTNNIIRTSLLFDSETRFWVTEISNNGWPIPTSFTLKHLTTRGEKTTDSEGSGVGGADIKAIVEKYGGVFDIKNDENAEFPVTYIITLPQVVFTL